MPDRYAVFGNPIAHSQSPRIHALFAAQTGQDMRYEALLAPLDGFVVAVDAFVRSGGKGANVTVPFKEAAFRLASALTPRAEAAGAVNTLSFDGASIRGDNTDGAGLVTDLKTNLGCDIAGKRILLLGAGGAARGVILPLLQEQPAALVIANRTEEKAVRLAREFSGNTQLIDPVSVNLKPPFGLSLSKPCAPFDKLRANVQVGGGRINRPEASGFAQLAGQAFDLVINATSTGLSDTALPLPPQLFAPGALAYEMVYGRETPFMQQAREAGARVADGLGMLVEQAAEAFHIWRGVRPASGPVLAVLRG